MDSVILLAAMAAVPILLGLFLRVSAVFMFLSLAVGSLLVTFLGDDASLALSTVVRGSHTTMFAEIGMLIGPVLLTMLVLKKTMPKSKVLLHLPVVVATGLALAVLVLPLLSSDMQLKIFTSQYGDMLKEFQDIIIGAASIMALLLAWVSYKHKEEKSKKHHK